MTTPALEQLGRPRPLPALARCLRWLGVALILSLATLVSTFAEVMAPGPYTTWFNHHKRDLIVREHLIGAPVDRAIDVLGRPNGDRPPPYRRLSYSPYPWFPFGEVRVYARDGVTASYKLFVD